MPENKIIDAVLDTDAYNEIDDQFAISYLLKKEQRIRTVALYAAPFFNDKVKSACEGMEASYNEILHVSSLCGKTVPTFRGSENYLPDEHTPVLSDAARDLAERALEYSPENPLYVVAIGAITNVASALLLEPRIAKNIVIVWLGGHALEFGSGEFNLMQDYPAARVVMGSEAKFVQLPCKGVVTHFTLSKADMQSFFVGKSPLASYLASHAMEEAEKYSPYKTWTRVIWDVTAVAWLLNDENRFMESVEIPVRLPEEATRGYEQKPIDKTMTYVNYINRDVLMQDLVDTILS